MKTLSISALLCMLLVFNCNNNEHSATHHLQAVLNQTDKQLFVIARNIPDADKLTSEQLEGISKTSCNVLDELGPDIKWIHSYVSNDKIFCVYSAKNKALIEEHAKKGGFPADNIVAVSSIIDPDTAK